MQLNNDILLAATGKSMPVVDVGVKKRESKKVPSAATTTDR